MAQATLLVIQGIDQGARFELGDEKVSVGRGVGNQIRILDTEVSRLHASLSPLNGVYAVTDEGSSNGTFVNGVAVRTKELKSGDQIQFGRCIFLFMSDGPMREATSVAERVDFLGQHDPSDRSSIVSEIGHETTPHFLHDTATTGLPAFAQTLANLQALYRISEEAVSANLSQEQMLQRILDLTIEVVGADRGCTLLNDAETGMIQPQVFSHRRSADISTKMPVSRSIVDYVLKKGQGVRTTDARTDHRFEAGQSILQAGIREAMCVPLRGRGELMGVIYVDTTTAPEQVILKRKSTSNFSEEQLRLLVAIGRQAALAVENNRYQHALVKAERLAAMGQTIATLSHHIKNILQGVRGGSYLIDMGLGDENHELIAKGWRIVEKNQNKIYHLVMDMLTFSKERQPALQKADLNETIADVCELMQSRAEECRVEFQWELTEELPLTTFDPEGIHRAALNIVANAVDAVEGQPDAVVDIRTGYDSASDRVFIAVTDNGPGIPADQLTRIFNIFESTKGARGTGLGLAVSQKIIREHGGEIVVESTPGHGCRFTLAWPRMDDEPPDESHTMM